MGLIRGEGRGEELVLWLDLGVTGHNVIDIASIELARGAVGADKNNYQVIRLGTPGQPVQIRLDLARRGLGIQHNMHILRLEAADLGIFQQRSEILRVLAGIIQARHALVSKLANTNYQRPFLLHGASHVASRSGGGGQGKGIQSLVQGL